MPCECPNCRKDNILNGTLTTEKCPICSVVFEAKSLFQIMPDKTIVCNDCISKHFVKCGFCNKLHRADSLKSARRTNDQNEISEVKVCERCWNQNYRECQECHEVFDKHSVMQHNDKCLCKPCFNKSYQQCSHCSSIVPIGSITRTIRSNHYVCDKCFDFFGPIELYERKPKMEFHGIPPHFLGVELEVELENAQREQRGKKAQEVVDLFPEDFVILKEDGSITCGFEIVTQPSTVDEHIKMWNPFFDKLPTNLKSFNTQNCGLHVHCSRKPLSLLTIAKIVVFANHPDNQKFIETIAGRSTCRYCAIKQKTYKGIRDGVLTQRNERYEAVNLCNKDTIEFRIFKGTLKRESFFKAVEFCDSLVKFCLPANHSISYCRSQKNYIEYVNVNKKIYPHLHAFISAKIQKKETKETKKFGFSVESKDSTPDLNK